MNQTKNQPLWRRTTYALSGLSKATASEHSLRTELAIVPVVVVVLALLRVEAQWWALAALACAAVITAELVNTAIEYLCDHLHPEQHPVVGAVKDCAAAAVFISCTGAVAVGIALAVHIYYRDFAAH